MLTLSLESCVDQLTVSCGVVAIFLNERSPSAEVVEGPGKHGQGRRGGCDKVHLICIAHLSDVNVANGGPSQHQQG